MENILLTQAPRLNRIPNVPATAIIYKITIGTKYYIGSTKGSLQARLLTHYKKAKLFPERKIYKAISELGGWHRCSIEVLKTSSYTTKEALLLEEKTLFNLSDPLCLNSISAIGQFI
jgi:hypothetical protein